MANIRVQLRQWRSGAPGIWIYVGALVVTSAVLRSASPSLSQELARQVSTNLYQMGQSAGRVLLLSAFVVDQGSVVLMTAWIVAVYAPVERWIGTARWLFVAAAGHVGATLVTTFGIWIDVRHHRGTSALVQAIDVGPSYGVRAVTAFLLVALRPWWARVPGLAVFAFLTVWPFFGSPTFTDTGHAAAACIGLAMWVMVGTRPPTHWLVSPWLSGGRVTFRRAVTATSTVAATSTL